MTRIIGPNTLAAILIVILACHMNGQSRDLPRIARPSRTDRVLVIAPHIDDEAIGAAGFISDALAVGAEVFVAYVTAGDCNRTSAVIEERTFEPGAAGFLEEGEMRLREGRDALAVLGVTVEHLFVLGYPDRGLLAMWQRPNETIVSVATGRNSVPYSGALTPSAPYRLQNLERDMLTVMGRARPTIVIAPVDFDRHPDHRVTAWVVARTAPAAAVQLGYLVHALGFPDPFLYVRGDALVPPWQERDHAWRTYPLSRAAERRKHKVLERYRSQRLDPYLFLLTDAFVRSNELFVLQRQ